MTGKKTDMATLQKFTPGCIKHHKRRPRASFLFRN
jgi:hypothetical protein